MTSPIPSLSVAHALIGLPILPIKRVRIMTDKEFEKLVEAWADRLKHRYISVAHFGGAGDKGVDVAGFCDDHGNSRAYGTASNASIGIIRYTLPMFMPTLAS